MKKSCWFLCLALLASPLGAVEKSFDEFLDTFAVEWVRGDPQTATALQYFTGAEQDALDRRLTPFTPESRAARIALAQRGLAELAPYDRRAMSAAQRVSAAMFHWQLEDFVQQSEFDDTYFVFNQLTGLQAGLINFLTQTHPIRNRRDIENYLARLGQAGQLMNEGLAQAKVSAARGILPPKFILTATLGQFERFLATAPAQNVFVASLDERAAKLAEVSAEDRAKFSATAVQIVTESVIPAFQRAQALLQSQLPQSTDDAGLWRLPGGDRAYTSALRTFTTTDFTAEQIHAMGLREVANIEREMDELFRELGYADGTIKQRLDQLAADRQPAEADPRSRLLAEYTAIARDAEKRAALLFDVRPQAPLEVRRIPEITEKNSAPNYTQPAPDGTRPGIFWVTLPGPTYPVVTMRTLTYHEAVPGHHFQIALQLEMKDLPRFRRDGIFNFISAHGEGWALYAERLAVESG